MITMKNANMIAWLNPTAIVGSASGSCTLSSFCRLVAPDISAASVISGGTVRNPSMVYRVSGTVVKITIDSTTVTSETPKSMIAGSR
ncbi:hypothetical protein ROA7745_00001 [Roseovarius aestuarii]|uniref:Uncharacterized protein n=1 Tax=Roseovarius aestuarii TaxID=475083 RepID=A0A1X7BLS8_9RHOB|nr:hypothetical protein ROA7745_00001 [Roseovarius aestuarii]